MKNKINSLQALRGIAFLGIFLLHAGAWVYWATLGVSIFFVLSGFLLTYKNADRDIELSLKNSVMFSINKIKKLYPLHIITMLLYIVALYYAGIADIADFLKKLIANVLLIQTWSLEERINMSFNAVAWYLSVMLVLYFAFPLILKLIKKIKKSSTLILISVAIWILQYIVSVMGLYFNANNPEFYVWLTYDFPLYRLGDFIIGCNVAYIYLNSSKKSMSIIKATIIEIVSLAAYIFITLWIKQEQTSIFIKAITKNYTFIFVPFAVMAVILFVYNNGIITKLLNNRFFVYLGNISAYAFLIHYVVVKYVKTGLMHLKQYPDQKTVLVIFILTIIFTQVYVFVSNRIKRLRS